MDRNRDPAPDGLKFGAFRSAKPWMPAIPQRSVVKKQQSFLMDMEDDDAGHSATPLDWRASVPFQPFSAKLAFSRCISSGKVSVSAGVCHISGGKLK